MLVKAFPTLYKKNSKEKVQVWDLSVVGTDEGFKIVTQYGEKGGKIQITQDLITEGKNIGRANETSPEAQALLEAQSNWTHKQDREGYVKQLDLVDQDLRDGLDPMLAHRYDKHPDKMPEVCYTQPKLDGHRCLAVYRDGKCTLFSRTRNIISGVPHINKEVERILEGTTGVAVLDGELYNHDYKNKFEELTGFIRSETPKEGHEVVQYHLYDIVYDVPFEDRNFALRAMEQEFGNKGCIRFVETHLINTLHIVPYFRKFREQGYEGGMLRDPKAKYIHKRSYGLLKVKEFDDAEFQIVAVGEGRGKLKGHAIFQCSVEDNNSDAARFDVKLKGDTKKLKEIFENQSEYIGKLLTVQFQGRTKNNIPRFPVGVRLRENV